MSNLDQQTDVTDEPHVGKAIHDLVRELFPICRSITGDGVRSTLEIIRERIPIKIFEVPSGTQAFDWSVPSEWNIRDAFVENERGEKIIDFKKHNLHVVSYSIPVDRFMALSELDKHLYSLEDQPNATPYVTSYYGENWGFCLPHNQRIALKDGMYHVVIDSDLKPGHLTYAELIIPGETEKEIFLSTYICHPSMANNELSGPAVLTFIAQWIATNYHRYSYRIVFVPETIGSIVYLSNKMASLKKNVIAGFNLSCLGDDKGYSYVSSRYGDTLADKTAANILRFGHSEYKIYSFLDRGSDERQYCSPGIDLPLVTLCRSKYGTYSEYHTSLDNLEFVTPDGLAGGYQFVRKCIEALEHNEHYVINCLGEPQLGKRGLYPILGTKGSGRQVKKMTNFIAYADGSNDLIDISNIIGVPLDELYPIVKKLLDAGLIGVQKDVSRMVLSKRGTRDVF
jgi:aminopeptidase-like protein